MDILQLETQLVELEHQVRLLKLQIKTQQTKAKAIFSAEYKARAAENTKAREDAKVQAAANREASQRRKALAQITRDCKAIDKANR